MSTELLVAILAGLGSMIGWGFADFFAKKTIDKIGDINTLFWSQLFGIIPLDILFLINPTIPGKLAGNGFILVIILGIWSGFSYIPTYIAFGKGKVSLISPIFASYAVLVAILSAVFLQEIIPLGRQIAFFVVFVGILLISINLKNIFSLKKSNTNTPHEPVKGLKEILFSVIFFSIWFIALDKFISGENWVPILLLIRIFSALSLFVYAKIRNISLSVTDQSLWKYLLMIGLFDVGAFSATSYGFSHTSYVSVVAMLGSAFSVPTIILARVFLKEKVTLYQTAGSIVVIMGIMLLSLL